jgi:hypothetical protein
MGVTGQYLHERYRWVPRGAISAAAFVAIEVGENSCPLPKPKDYALTTPRVA